MDQTLAALPESRLLAWLRLSRIPNLGPVLIKRAVESLGTPEAVLAAHPPVLATIEGIGTLRAQAFSAALSPDAARRELATLRQHGFELLCPDDPRWPAGLKTIPDPPIILHLRGTLLPQDNLAVGIVGARQCSMYGREQAARFGAQLAHAGFTVISGGARGVDSAAHEGTLRNKGRTIVIQGCGLLNCYPPENAALYERIVAAGGAILSELPLDAPPAKENFPPRNRIIAGMSLGILVVEANLRSGSLITARLAAADYGREVFALPGRVDSPASAGTHHLIKSATAHLVENVEDILNALGEVGTAMRQIPTISQTPDGEEANGCHALRYTAKHVPEPTDAHQKGLPFSDPTENPDPTPRFTASQQKILTALTTDPISIDDLLERTALPPSVLMAELTMLQIRAAITRTPNNHFTKRPASSG